MSMLEKLNKIGITHKDIHLSNFSLQRRLAPKLRNAAIKNLTDGTGIVATSFKDTYQIIANVENSEYIGRDANYKTFLKKQSRQGIVGTYIEAESLGELLHINIFVTRLLKDEPEVKWCLHNTFDEKAPCIHLYCADDRHWFSTKNHPEQTLGEKNNCLYNAIAQELQKIVIKEEAEEKNNKETKPLFFESETVLYQKEILRLIKQRSQPSEVLKKIIAEMQEEDLPKAKKQEIIDNYKAALTMAYEDFLESKKMALG